MVHVPSLRVAADSDNSYSLELQAESWTHSTFARVVFLSWLDWPIRLFHGCAPPQDKHR